MNTTNLNKEGLTDANLSPHTMPAPKEISPEQVPIHELKRRVKEKYPDIKVKNTYKKVDLIKILKTGVDPEKKKEVKRAPIQVANEKASLPIIPKEIEGRLAELAKRGLTWEVDEETCSITFSRDLDACCTLDQPSNNILIAAHEAFGKDVPVEISHRKDLF